jgi:hypothetical protein
MHALRSKPRLTGPRRRGYFVPLAALVAVFMLGANPGLVFAWDSLTFSSTEEDHMITLTNQARASYGLNSLIEDATLRSVAEKRAKYIYDNQYPYHTQKDGQTAFTMLQALGYCYKAAGENLGYNNYSDSQTTQWQFNWFMNSSAHRANILGTGWDHIGVGAYKGNNSGSVYYHVFVMIFADKCGTTATATPKPTPTPTPKPTATPRPTPTPTPRPSTKATPKPTSAQTATPDATPALSPDGSPGLSPDLSFDASLTTDPRDPEQIGGSAIWTPWEIEARPWVSPNPDGPFPFVTPDPTPTPEATLDESGGGSTLVDTGLAVVDPVPDQNLLDAIVGGVVSSYFGP